MKSHDYKVVNEPNFPTYSAVEAAKMFFFHLKVCKLCGGKLFVALVCWSRHRAELQNQLREHVGSGGVRRPLHLPPLRHLLALCGSDGGAALRPPVRLQHQRGEFKDATERGENSVDPVWVSVSKITHEPCDRYERNAESSPSSMFYSDLVLTGAPSGNRNVRLVIS